MFVCDTAATVSRERTPEGFLRVRARIGRVGLHDYKAREIGGPPGAAPDATVRVFRPPEDVFDAASMASFAGKPVTLDHPPVMIDSANWKRFAVGHAGTAVIRQDDHLATDLLITDAAAVARAEAGAELSNGYWADFVFTPGTTPQGEAYDAVQRNIRGNHVALVDAGRCGPTCRVDGTADAACACDGPDRRSLTLDGVVIETTPEGAAAIARLQADLEAAEAGQRRAVAVRDGEIAALKAAAPDPAMMDRLVAERMQVIDTARSILGRAFDPSGLSTAALRRAAVEKVLGAAQIRDRGEDYVAAAFDTLGAARALVPHASPDILAAHLGAGLTDGAAARESALASRNRYLTQAWKGDAAQGQTFGAS